jgi:hypothetical protein
MGYDRGVLRNPSFESTVPGAAVALDTSRVVSGLVGVTMVLPSGSAFFRTNQQAIGQFTFEVIPGENPLMGRLSFTHLPVPLAATNTAGDSLALAAALSPSGRVLQAEPFLHVHSGLFRQQLLLSNPTDAPFTNVLMTAYGLGQDTQGNDIVFYNAHTQDMIDPDQDGLATEESVASVEVPEGQSVVATVEFYVADRQTIPQPSYAFSFGSVKGVSLPLVYTRIQVRDRRVVDGEFVMEFSTLENRNYYIQYADTPEGLRNRNSPKTSAPLIIGTGGVMRWFDTGPPRTISLPEEGMRFYKVMMRGTYP